MRNFPKAALLLTALAAVGTTSHSAETIPPVKTIELEWEAVENAGSFEVKLIPEDGGADLLFQAPQNQLSQSVPIGNDKLQIRSKSKDGKDTSPWTAAIPLAVVARELTPLEPQDRSTVDGSSKKKQTVMFRWTPIENIKEYTLNIWSEDRKEKLFSFKTSSTSKKIDMPTAQIYHWQVVFVSADAVTYQQNPKTFSFTLLGDRLLKPEIAPFTPPQIDEFKWKGPPQTSSYEATLYFRHLDETEWKPVQKQTQDQTRMRIVPPLRTGAYKLEVIAKSARQLQSEPATREFTIKPPLSQVNELLRQAQLSEIQK